jgi:hypothetical protein
MLQPAEVKTRQARVEEAEEVGGAFKARQAGNRARELVPALDTRRKLNFG